ncbi:Hsp33 family molecular chaperone HslO [Mesomycoplasma lagogenitalium]|uniref:Hsp33 family molecular chaperone HslO n=1 Tax=Mesomycoplasma lagogenitalium TaxID=171286 RepID=A0ABY8LTM8_9BACT|nr:Hsp33 family molecular chaperone HslO [Mesomycoplasma lagogenitalium]WGI36594.1 Hsp33 family molecular chaperone HslO [Mesomycoplasma lagogenitalium]
MDSVKILIKNNIRIIASNVTDVCQKAIEYQETLPFTSLILAKAISVFAPLSFILSAKEGKVTSFIKSDGAIKNLIVESKNDGSIRALIGNPNIETEKDDSDFENTPLILGIGNEGILRITRTSGTHTFGGEVKLVKSDLITDLAYYFEVSEQIFTAIRSTVKFENKNKIQRANSIIFQLLPNHQEDDIVWIENFIKNNDLETTNLQDYINKMEANLLSEKPIFWKCEFDRNKVISVLQDVVKKEKNDLFENDEKIEIECHFCKEKFYFSREEIS